MPNPTRSSGRRRRTATDAVAPLGPSNHYIYRDENGELLFRVVRGRGKRFYQERFEDGGWKKGLARNTQRVLYNMPAVMDAATHRKVVFVVEGEKDADALIAQGVTATTNPGGAGKWRDEYSFMLMGVRYVVIIWDNDQQDPKTGRYPGQEHALQVEASLKTCGVPVRLARASEGKDVFDHLAAGRTVDQLVYERPGDPLVAPETNGHSNTGTGPKRLPAVYQLAMFKLREHAETHNLPQPRETDKGYEACCPAHEDTRPSLGVMVGDEQPLVVACQRGCTVQEIADALDIDIKEFGTKKPDHDAETARELTRMRAREAARVILLGEQAPEVEAPMETPEEYMTAPLPEHPYTIEELHITGSNTLIVSRYKVGKTILMQNLFRSLVNGEEFLGHFGVQQPEGGGRIAYLDYEMQKKQFRAWLQAGGELDRSRMVAPWHLRGQSLHFWVDGVRQQFIDWLQRNNVQAIIIDTAARAWAGLVENENSNSEILRFTDMLDRVKDAAGVQDLFLVTHTGRDSVFIPEGEERARGATRLEDWMDSGWYYTKDDTGTRYLRAIGRGVDMDPVALSYDPHTHHLLTSGVSKKEHQAQMGLQMVVDCVAQLDEPPTMTELKDMLQGGDNHAKLRFILEAETRGLIERDKGKGRTVHCSLTEAGMRLHQRKISLNGEGE